MTSEAYRQGDDVITPDEQIEIVNRLGLTVEDVLKDPFKLIKAGIEFLGNLPSSKVRIEHLNDMNDNQKADFRQKVRDFMHALTH